MDIALRKTPLQAEISALRKFLATAEPQEVTKLKAETSCHFEVAGLNRKCWSNATPIRAIFRDAFESAGLPYFNPHSFRKTLAQLGERLCRTPEEFKAWSQNLGHEDVLTTFASYGAVPSVRQAALIRGLGNAAKVGSPLPVDERLARLEAAVRLRSESVAV